MDGKTSPEAWIRQRLIMLPWDAACVVVRFCVECSLVSVRASTRGGGFILEPLCIPYTLWTGFEVFLVMFGMPGWFNH